MRPPRRRPRCPRHVPLPAPAAAVAPARSVEALESRVLLSAALVADLAPGNGASAPANLVEANGSLYFTANGNNLYKSDGTAAGTKLLAQLPNTLTDLTAAGGRVFFVVGGGPLWTSDGTPGGTARIGGAFDPHQDLVAVGNTAFFTTDSGTSLQLWKSDGTAQGTVAVTQVPNDFNASVANHDLIQVNGTLYFETASSPNHYQLWKSDGTAAGTVSFASFADFFISAAPDPPASLTAVPTAGGTVLFFSANDGAHGTELWRTDGTAAGTTMAGDLVPGAGSSTPLHLTAFRGGVLFTSSPASGNANLYWADAAPGGTVYGLGLVGTGYTKARTFFGVSGNPAGNLAYFANYNGASGVELWSTDSIGAQLVKDIAPGASNSSPDDFADVGGTLYFTAAADGAYGRKLWQSDGTAVGTVQTADIGPVAGSSGASALTTVEGTLFFSADDGVHGQELWKFTTPLTAPTGPSAAGIGASRIDLSWAYPGSDATGFVVERSTDGQNFAPVTTLAGAAVNAYSDTTNLAPLTRYYYRFRATRTDGTLSPPSAVVSAVTQGTPPAAPSALAVASVPASTTTLSLSWTDNSNTETGFRIERSSDGGKTFTEITPSPAAPANATNFTDTGLSPATTYTYRLRATNPTGDSAYSNTATATTLTPESPFTGGPYAVPGVIQAENFDAGSSTISYSSSSAGNNGGTYRPGAVNIDPVKYPDGTGGYAVTALPGAWLKYTVNVASAGTYNLELRLTASNVSPFHLEVDGVDRTGAVPVPLVPDASYRTVTAAGIPLTAGAHVIRLVFDPSSTGNNGEADVDWLRLLDASTVSAPAAPSNVSSFALNGPSVDLTWQTPAGSSPATSYKVYRKTGPNGPLVQLALIDGGTTRFTDTAVQPLTAYGYAIVATDSAGDSPLSAAAAAVTTLDAPAREVKPVGLFNSLTGLTDVNGTLYFLSNPYTPIPNSLDAQGWGYESQLWKSDGTAAGTVAVAGAPAGAYGVFTVNGRVLFFAPDPASASEGLWALDPQGGPPAELQPLNVPAPNSGSTQGKTPDVQPPAFLNGTAYFTAGATLWKTDGTAAGTAAVSTLPSADTGPFEGAAVGNTLLFTRSYYSGGPETQTTDLFETDGTAGGTSLVHSFTGGITGRDQPSWLTAFDGAGGSAGGAAVYFRAGDAGATYRMWRSDGTAAGTYPVTTLDVFNLHVANNRLLYYGTAGSNAAAVYSSDGTAAGNVQISPSLGYPNFWTGQFIDAAGAGGPGAPGGTTYFLDGYGEIWRTDGTPRGTAQLTQLGGPRIAPLDGTVLFETTTAIRFTNGVAPDEPLTLTSDGYPQNLTVSGPLAFFTWDNGAQLWCAGAPPAAPSVTVGQVGASGNTINWTVVPPRVNPIATFVVERKGPSDSTYFPIADVPAAARTFTDSDLQSGQSYLYRVRAVNASGSSASAAVSATPPVVTTTAVSNGAASRSMVTSLTVRFSQPVALGPGALTLSRLTTDATGAVLSSTDVSAGVAWSSVDGGTFWVASVVPGGAADGGGGSLADGVYRLTIHPAAVTNVAGGLAMAGGDQVLSTFHRLFGDTDGNGTVNALDYAKFKSAFGASAGSAGYSAALDYDGNGTVNALDYAQFKKRFGTTFAY